ncbi:carbohydrate ABC transporter permease [Paenibacillus psychroresistens]|uniref:Carbohydrate ABC transporter permease n=1 Tax=Paenibacillus psychroresistens TaxID=1778678 RepID=A0A6B8RTJ2_9BACL|nr:carbohydrate ABC transporter permease [Paenibacillus psychroresistens]QGQ98773.1 carbohydrate ABC transporter permease [Paenibacillus psychroresistens]
MKSLKQSKLSTSIYTLLMYILALFFIYPFFVLFVSTFKEEKYIFDPSYIPNFLDFSNYRLVFSSPTFFTALLNTVLICVVTLFILIIVSSMAGYVVSRSNEFLFKSMYYIFVFALIIPTQANMVVLFRLGTTLHIINTIPYLILLYVAGNVSYTSLIYAGFTKSIPRQLEEAASIDGCSRLKTFILIIFPLLLPATATVVVVEVFWYWNDLQGPLIFLNNGKVHTLMLEIYNFRSFIGSTSYTTTAWGPVSTICLIATIPVLIFFMFTQKYLLNALTVGAIKG